MKAAWLSNPGTAVYIDLKSLNFTLVMSCESSYPYLVGMCHMASLLIH